MRGQGNKHLPSYHVSTLETVWLHEGSSEEQVASREFNPQMFNSFPDGTKSTPEMAAVANNCGLVPPRDGLKFPPCGVWDLPEVLRPRGESGGILDESGTVEVVSSLELDGREVFNHLK
jgi:predicted homoserine dehydrogenase-like protein